MRLDHKANVTSRLPIEPKLDATGVNYIHGGLCLGRLERIFLDEDDYKEGEFKDKKVTTLNFEFTNFRTTSDEPDRYYVHKEKIIGTVQKKDGALTPRPVKEISENIRDMWFRIKHILDQCKYSPNFRNIEDLPDDVAAEHLVLPEEGTVEERLIAFDKFFNFIHAFAVGNGTDVLPMYHTAEKEGVVMWMKLLPVYKTYDRYTFPTWVSQGFLEAALMDNGNPTPAKILYIKATENLALTPVKRDTVAVPGTPAPGGQGVQSAVDYIKNMRAAATAPK